MRASTTSWNLTAMSTKNDWRIEAPIESASSAESVPVSDSASKLIPVPDSSHRSKPSSNLGFTM